MTDLKKPHLHCPTPGKKRYLTEATAIHVAETLTAQSGVEMEPYRCRCDLWHLCRAGKQRETTERYERTLEQARAAGFRPWQTWEDELVLSNLTIAELIQTLGRPARAVYGRRKLLRQGETG